MRNLHLPPRTRNITTGLERDRAAATCVKWSTTKKKKKKKSQYVLSYAKALSSAHTLLHIFAVCKLSKAADKSVRVRTLRTLLEHSHRRVMRTSARLSIAHTHKHTHTKVEKVACGRCASTVPEGCVLFSHSVIWWDKRSSHTHTHTNTHAQVFIFLLNIDHVHICLQSVFLEMCVGVACQISILRDKLTLSFP